MALATKGVFAVSAKLFVTDMDGTLLNSERKISAGNKAMIKKAVEAGVIFTIATGRMYASALPFAKDLGVEVPIITYNGAVIKTTAGKEIFTSYLDQANHRPRLIFFFARSQISDPGLARFFLKF